MNEPQKDMDKIIQNNIVNNIMKNKNSDVLINKDVHKRNYFKIGAYVGTFLIALAEMLGIGGEKQVKAQDIFAKPSQYMKDKDSGRVTAGLGVYKDKNAQAADLIEEFRVSVGAEGVATFNVGEPGEPEISVFGNYHLFRPGRDVSQAQSGMVGAQATFYSGAFFAAMAAAWQYKDFNFNKESSHGNLTYVDQINQIIGRLALGANDAQDSGWYGFLATEFKANFIGSQEYNEDTSDANVQAHLEKFLASGENFDTSIYARMVYKHENSQEYFISDAVKVDSLSIEAGIDHMISKYFGLGVSLGCEMIWPDNAAGNNMREDVLGKIASRLHFKPHDKEGNDFMEITLSLWYEGMGISKDEAGAQLDFTFYFPTISRMAEKIKEPSGKSGISKRGGKVSFMSSSESKPKQNYIPKVKNYTGRTHKQ